MSGGDPQITGVDTHVINTVNFSSVESLQVSVCEDRSGSKDIEH